MRSAVPSAARRATLGALGALAASVLAGCPWVSPSEWRSVEDHDGDGGISLQFGGDDCRDEDPDIASCDVDQDGFRSLAAGGDDCDDHDASVVPGRTFFQDLDGDGFGNPRRAVVACEAGSLLSANDLDCDDDDADIRPGVPETCDDADRNCDGDPYLGGGGRQFPLDRDGDGFGGDAVGDEFRCVPGPKETEVEGDCDDFDADVFPGSPNEVWYDGVDTDCAGDSDFDQDGDGEDSRAEIGGPDCADRDRARNTDAPELCNGIDDDCDTRVDDADDDADQVGQFPYYRDGDGDGAGTAPAVLWCAGAEPPGHVVVGGDCDDTNPARRPGTVERCNGVDDDCNLVADDNPVGGTRVFVDDDEDGWGSSLDAGARCDVTDLAENEALFDGDCDDQDDERYPGAHERCGDSVRQDCDPGDPADCDLDGDLDGTDCADEDPLVHAGAIEVCDGIDNDCNLAVDGADPFVDASTARAWYLDVDHDGFGSPGAWLAETCNRPADSADNELDCDDTSAARNPAADERCNALDDDCDGVADEEPTDAPTWYLDLDGDGAGDDGVTVDGQCAAPDPLWVSLGGDCSPGDPTVHPGAAEICDAGRDDDCDGLGDDDDPGLVGASWFRDDDLDGYGVTADVVVACATQAGRTQRGGDCNDSSAAVNPGATEFCDAGIDNDCDGFADDADASSGAVAFYLDVDADGYGWSGDPSPLVRCAPPYGRVANDADCDDTRAFVNPGMPEVCGGTDEDCDGVQDDADPTTLDRRVWYLDVDTDGVPGSPVLRCGDPGALGALDCNDLNPAVYPGAPEVCDAVDDDCNGLVDDVVVQMLPDLDFDGFGDGSAAPYDGTCTQQADEVPYDPAGEVPVDCDDTTPLASPLYPYELCSDAIDNDCDGVTDETTPPSLGCGSGGTGGVDAPPLHLWWPDADGDTYGEVGAAPTLAAAQPLGHVANALDCDDATGLVTPVLVGSQSALQTAVNALGAGACGGFELAEGSTFTSFAFVTGFAQAGAARTVSIGPRDASSDAHRALWEASTVAVDQNNAVVVLTGIDFAPVTAPTADFAIELTAGSLDLYDVQLLGEGGVRQTAGALTTHLLSIVDPPYPSANGASALSVTLGSTGSHTSDALRIVGAPGPYAVQADGGTFRGVTLEASAELRISVSSSGGPVTLTALEARDCTDDCVHLENNWFGGGRTITWSDSVVMGAGHDAASLYGLSGRVEVDHVTLVGARHDGITGGYADLTECIVWGSGGFDLAGGMLTLTRVLYDTTNGSPVSHTDPPPGVAVPGFQSWDPRLPSERWDVHLAQTDPFGIHAFRGGIVGAWPLTDPWYEDLDGDGLDDGWEVFHLGSTVAGDPQGDPDGDGATTGAEFAAGTWPLAADTDGDGSNDAVDGAPLDAVAR